nr:MAG TPA: hypothetical protein [Caudoviricetes sp.]
MNYFIIPHNRDYKMRMESSIYHFYNIYLL